MADLHSYAAVNSRDAFIRRHCDYLAGWRPFFLMCQRSCESFDSTTKQGEPKLTMKLDADGLNGGNLEHVRRAKFRKVVVECVIVRNRARDIVSSNGFSAW